MYLIKALLSRRRDRWRRLGCELAREISRLPQTTPFICVFPFFLTSRSLVYALAGRRRGCMSMRGSRGPNLLSAGNEDCAVNSDPVARVHKVGMANSLCWRSGSAVMGTGGGTLTGSIILEERRDYYSQPCLPKKEGNQRKLNLAWRSASLSCLCSYNLTNAVYLFGKLHSIKRGKIEGGGSSHLSMPAAKRNGVIMWKGARKSQKAANLSMCCRIGSSVTAAPWWMPSELRYMLMKVCS